MSPLVICFAPHFPDFPDPLLATDFETNFEQCDTFILDYAEQWMEDDPDRELRYNELSAGRLKYVLPIGCPEETPLEPFTKQLQDTIRGKGKRVILEQSPVPFAAPSMADIREQLFLGEVDSALAMFREQQETFARGMMERDQALISGIIEREIKTGAKLFLFRGAAHHRYVCKLLNDPSIQVIQYADPPLSERVVAALMMGESVPPLDFLRVLYSEYNRRGYQNWIALQKETESLSEQQIRAALPRRHIG
jgi:hypothetical protein